MRREREDGRQLGKEIVAAIKLKGEYGVENTSSFRLRRGGQLGGVE